ncbi:MAG: hypothetical protein Kow00127_00520 [Bacteroidales bacterium]
MENIVKIYSERNSGNIYLEWLLKKNFDALIPDTPEYGWKHRIAPEKDELSEEILNSTCFIYLVKNPYSWLLSLHKRPYNHEELRKIRFSQFIRVSFGDYRNPVVMWNRKTNSFLEFSRFAPRFLLVRYEDIIEDFRDVLNRIADHFGWEKPELYRNITNLLTHSHGIKSRPFHRDFYLNEKWKESLRGADIDHINTYLDHDLMRKLNYQIL